MPETRRYTPGLVSIGVPTFNRAALLRETLDGLLRQDHPALEILISDNHSTDETPAVAAEYCQRYASVHYLRQPKPVPVAENFRTPLRLATGEFFMWAADDDSRVDSFVSSLARVLRENPETVLAAGEAQYRLPDGTLLTFFAEGRAWYGDGEASSPQARLRRVVDHSYGNLIYGLYRRSALFEGSRTILDGWQSLNELPVFLQVAALGEIRVLPEVLMYKTAPLPVFVAAAREYGVAPPEAADISWPSGWRHIVGASRQVVTYHLAALRDALRASRSLPVPATTRAKVAARLGVHVTRHCVRVVRQTARQGRQSAALR